MANPRDLPFGARYPVRPGMDLGQAIIGFGSALIGAVVGGMFVLLGARGQWKRDRLARAHQAAQRILVALVPLEGVFVTLARSRESELKREKAIAGGRARWPAARGVRPERSCRLVERSSDHLGGHTAPPGRS